MQVINPDEAVLVVGEEAVPVGEEVEMVDDQLMSRLMMLIMLMSMRTLRFRRGTHVDTSEDCVVLLLPSNLLPLQPSHLLLLLPGLLLLLATRLSSLDVRIGLPALQASLLLHSQLLSNRLFIFRIPIYNSLLLLYSIITGLDFSMIYQRSPLLTWASLYSLLNLIHRLVQIELICLVDMKYMCAG